MLSKLYMASKNLSQAPILFLPWAWLCKLSPRPCDIPIPRHKFSERQSKEFQKTAELMKQWDYMQAHNYLMELAT